MEMETEHTSIWLRPVRGSRGRAPEHTRDGIAAVAVQLADSDGLGAVTMRSVAQALGGGSASLYRYVQSRDELVALMVDQVNGEIDYSVLGHTDWLADLLALGGQSRAVYLRHPWLTDTPAAPGDLGPHAVEYLEHALGALQGLDVEGHRKLEAIGVFSAVVRLLVRTEIEQLGTDPVDRRRRLAAAAHVAHLVQDGAHPHLAAALSAPPAEADENQTERLLTRVLRGLLGV
ncbi:TetR/AcrR family transcriptional regulator [Cellulomonas sp. P5_C5]